MEIRVYDTGENYLLTEVVNGSVLRGLVVDKDGDMWEDLESFVTWEARLGAVMLNGWSSSELAGRSMHLATVKNGEIVEETSFALDDDTWERYASI